MGCDIHMFIEKREDKTFAWKLDENHSRDDDELDEDGKVKYVGHWIDVPATGRNYHLFNTLAGVRGSGGLYEPRGIPDDSSPGYLEAVDQYGVNGHSHSYLSLEEFKECLLEEGYDLSEENPSTRAFYEYSYFKNYEDMPPDYTTVYHYMVKWLKDQERENSDIIPQLRLDAEIRICFFFDN